MIDPEPTAATIRALVDRTTYPEAGWRARVTYQRRIAELMADREPVTGLLYRAEYAEHYNPEPDPGHSPNYERSPNE